MCRTHDLAARLDNYLADLRHLVAIDSGTYDRAGANQVNDWLMARLLPLGFRIQRFPQTETGDHMLATLTGQGRRKILLLGHSDTVYPAGTAAARPLTQVGDKLLGPGTCDMKAGLLTGLYAIEALLWADFNDFAELRLLVVADEEVDQRTSITLIQESISNCDAVLTLEAARENGDIVTARKGNIVMRVEAAGKSAHAGVEPEMGRSAISALMRRLIRVELLENSVSGVTINVGTIHGGSAANVVPANASASIDIRAFTLAELEQVAAEAEAVFARDAVDGVAFSVSQRLASPPMPRTDEVARLEAMAIDEAAKLGFPLRGVSTGGAADSAFAAQAGVPVLDGLGPIGGLDHGPDEYISLSSIVPRTALLANLMIAICGAENEPDRFAFSPGG